VTTETCADGDGCSSNCYEVHESVISTIKPLGLTILAGNMYGTPAVKLKVRNADVTTHSIEVIPTTDCSGAAAFSNFGDQYNAPVAVEPGKTASGIREGGRDREFHVPAEPQGPRSLQRYADARAAGDFTTGSDTVEQRHQSCRSTLPTRTRPR
jgi:hypothetical protein